MVIQRRFRPSKVGMFCQPSKVFLNLWTFVIILYIDASQRVRSNQQSSTYFFYVNSTATDQNDGRTVIKSSFCQLSWISFSQCLHTAFSKHDVTPRHYAVTSLRYSERRVRSLPAKVWRLENGHISSFRCITTWKYLHLKPLSRLCSVIQILVDVLNKFALKSGAI